jgi:hypothetical protein
MIRREHRMDPNNTRSRAVLARDAALARLGRTRRWVIAGTAALTAGFAALVSAVAPGRSLAPKSAVRTVASTGASTGATASSSAIPQLPPAANPDSLGLGSPGQAPQSVPNPPAPAPQTQSSPAPQSSSGGGGVVSGGS